MLTTLISNSRNPKENVDVLKNWKWCFSSMPRTNGQVSRRRGGWSQWVNLHPSSLTKPLESDLGPVCSIYWQALQGPLSPGVAIHTAALTTFGWVPPTRSPRNMTGSVLCHHQLLVFCFSSSMWHHEMRGHIGWLEHWWISLLIWVMDVSERIAYDELKARGFSTWLQLS